MFFFLQKPLHVFNAYFYPYSITEPESQIPQIPNPITSVADPDLDSIGSVDPDSESGSGGNECGSPTLPITAVSNKGGEVKKNCF
jgi:hypothetical protein